ncbi:MAG: hypothetical protein ACFB4I_10130 [Cyanophyceae cyanobacterium]
MSVFNLRCCCKFIRSESSDDTQL